MNECVCVCSHICVGESFNIVTKNVKYIRIKKLKLISLSAQSSESVRIEEIYVFLNGHKNKENIKKT